MEDMRYDQYGAPMGYQSMEKQQGNFVNRNMPVNRYGNMPMGMMNQNRIPNQQQMNMMDQQKQGPVLNSPMGDRMMGMNNRENGDSSYQYNMMQNNRNAPSRNSMGIDGVEGKSLIKQNSTSSSYGVGSTPKQSPMQADLLDNEYTNSRNYYRWFSSAFSQQADSIGKLFYAIPTSFLFSTPSLTQEQMKQFSTTLLMYIFYSMPNDRFQNWAAQELCSRDCVYHKTNGHWYRKGSSNYASCKCIEVFDMESCTFVKCEEEYKNRDLLSLAELQECLKRSV